MDASVKKTSNGYEVTIKGRTVTLPLESKATEIANEVSMLGTPEKHLEIDPYANTITLVEEGKESEVIVPDEGDDEDRLNLVSKVMAEWAESQTGGRRRSRSRLNRKTRRAKRNGRNTKHRKLRNLASRRR